MDQADEDARDVARVLAGEPDAFEGIVRRRQRRLLNLAWRFCRDRAMAEDMAQEAFVKAFRSLKTFRGESAFATWLTTLALNSYRSRLRADGPPLLSLEPARAFAAEPTALRGLQERERAEAVRRAVLTLPQRYREAIVVYYFEERDLADSARTLGVAEGTLKARLHRARALLERRCADLGAAAGRASVEET